MNNETLADISVKITHVIKTNLDLPSQQLITKILDKIPELANDIDLTIEYLRSMANSLSIAYTDINDIISYIQGYAKKASSDIDWNTLWQSIAQGIYYVAKVIAGFLPPKWKEVILIVLGAYERLVL